MNRNYASYGSYARPHRRVAPTLLLILIVGIIIAVGVALTYKRWEGQPPQVAFDHDFKALGRNPALKVTVSDAGTGLKHVAIRLKQKDQDVVLADENLNREKSKTYDVGQLLGGKQIQDGAASLQVSATD